ncbi:hypothetical protein FPANT_10800 [Fusarium pseudoanthophilum]|uniref:Uncharacterized protein n=1 Tax=Fusarium pseudoanthophilum TaxID=48495 RepID=A0A8H5KQM1_9HYPO|nr:hypothetical protein FPANT_10800 [Fusarium pseudoanthophilum]
MPSTQEDPPNCYRVTGEGDSFVPKNARWKCNFGRYDRDKEECGGRNEDIQNEICSKCGNKRGSGATADLGEKKPGSEEIEPLWMFFREEDGSESWTIHFIDD